MRTFREAIQGEKFAITAELTLKRESSEDDVLQQADSLGPYVDGIQVSDNPFAWVQMSAVTAAGILIHHGIDPIPILTCRDRNRIALHSDLIGLRAVGVTSVLLMRGHRVPENHVIAATTVFDTTGRELIAMAADLGEDEKMGPGRAFLIGTGARAFRPNRGWRAESLLERANAGARFLQTQLCFNMDILRHYMKRFVEAKLTWKFSVMVSLSPLPSAKTAKWLKENMSDSRIPKSVIQRLEDAQDPEREGIEICAGLMREIAEIPGVSGVNLMTTGNAQSISAAIEASGLRN